MGGKAAAPKGDFRRTGSLWVMRHVLATLLILVAMLLVFPAEPNCHGACIEMYMRPRRRTVHRYLDLVTRRRPERRGAGNNSDTHCHARPNYLQT